MLARHSKTGCDLLLVFNMSGSPLSKFLDPPLMFHFTYYDHFTACLDKEPYTEAIHCLCIIRAV